MRFRAGSVEIHPLGGERRLLVGLRSGRALEGTVADAELLLACRQFRTLEEHAADAARRGELAGARRLASKGPRWLRAVIHQTERNVAPDPRRAEPIVRRLREMAEAGLLASREKFVEHALTTPRNVPAPIRTVGFTTRNRPALLRRAIESWTENTAQFGRGIAFTVIDDARTPEEETATGDALQALAGRGAAIRLAGPRRRDDYARTLADEAGVQFELVRFALRGDERCPVSTGSARNCLLLDSAGEPYVLADDDGVAQLAACPEPLPGLELTSGNDPTEFWFFRNQEDLAARVKFVARDLLGEHERLLGKSAGDLIAAAEQGDGLELRYLGLDFENRLRDGEVRVRTSMAGVVGDSGIGATAHLFTSPASQRRLTVSEELFHEAIRNRRSLRLPRRPTLGDGVITMAGNLGLDATEMLPPFCPVQRNSDGLLGRTLKQCLPAACKGYLDVAAFHDPPPGRSQSLEEWWEQVRRIRFPDVPAALLEAQPPGLSLPELGRRLTVAAAAPPAEFRGRLYGLLLRKQGQRLALDHSAEAGETPAFYASLRLRQIEEIRAAISKPEYLEPRDLPAERPLALAQELVGRFGELLEAWPLIWRAAVKLRAEGRRLASCLRSR